MKRFTLRQLVFMALCCDLGLLAKRLISPAANALTDYLRIPGGVSTSFSLMFLVVAACCVDQFGSASLMGAVQGGLALLLGRVGSMGALSPLGYLLPGMAMDAALWINRRRKKKPTDGAVAASMAASAAACLTANAIVFRLAGLPLALYLSVALTSGAICGLLATALIQRLASITQWTNLKGDRKI